MKTLGTRDSRDQRICENPIILIGRTRSVDNYRPPRLTIGHLLVLMVLVAILMSVIVASHATQTPNATNVAHKNDTLPWGLLVAGIIAAAVFLGTTTILWDKVHGCPGQLQPGHWFVLVTNVLYLCLLLFDFYYDRLDRKLLLLFIGTGLIIGSMVHPTKAYLASWSA